MCSGDKFHFASRAARHALRLEGPARAYLGHSTGLWTGDEVPCTAALLAVQYGPLDRWWSTMYSGATCGTVRASGQVIKYHTKRRYLRYSTGLWTGDEIPYTAALLQCWISFRRKYFCPHSASWWNFAIVQVSCCSPKVDDLHISAIQ